MNLHDRTWAKVRQGDPDECWPWQAALSSTGYGVAGWNGSSTSAHRAIWMLTYGEIPPGLMVCHACDNPPCCNPSHLFLGTQRENMQDAQRKGRIPTGRTPSRRVKHPERYRPKRCALCGVTTTRVSGLCRLHDPPRPIDHGTRSGYCRGCKCPACTEANSLYHRDRRRLKRETRQ